MFNTKDIDSQRFIERAKMLLERSNDSHNIHTPLELCQEVVSKIPSLDGKVLVIANLEFVYTLKRLDVPVENIHFATPCPLKAMAAKSLLSEHNVFVYNGVITKKDVGDMKFDVVVGNPPWNEGGIGKNKTFYHKFYHACLPLATKYFVFVSPAGFLFSRKNMFRELRAMLYTNGIESVQLLDSRKVFNVIADWCGIVFVDPNKKTSSFTLIHEDGTQREISTENPDVELRSKGSDVEEVLDKIKQQCTHTLYPKRGRQKQITKQGIPQTDDVSAAKVGAYKYSVVNRLREGVPQFIYARNVVDDDVKHHRVIYNIVSRKGGVGKSYIAVPNEQLTQVVCYITVNSMQEAESLQSYLNSKIFSALVTTHKSGVNNSLGVIRQLPRPDDKTKIWTDEELYAHFNLTEEEIKLIEDTIK